MLKVGDKVQVDFESTSINKLDKEVLINIKKWDKQYNSVHKITEVYTCGLWTDKEIRRYELNGYYIFSENEINKIEE